MSEKKDPDIRDLWIKAKAKENKAKTERVKIEEQLIEMFGTNFDGNSKTFKDDLFKTVIKKNKKYKMDQEKWEKVREQIPEEFRPEKISYALVEKGYLWLEENQPELFKIVSNCVEYKENKPTIDIEKIN